MIPIYMSKEIVAEMMASDRYRTLNVKAFLKNQAKVNLYWYWRHDVQYNEKFNVEYMMFKIMQKSVQKIESLTSTESNQPVGRHHEQLFLQ